VATQLGELAMSGDIIERILNHAPRTVAGKHYNHAKYLVPMRAGLDALADRLSAIVGERPDDVMRHRFRQALAVSATN
jgi:hypothetical protein